MNEKKYFLCSLINYYLDFSEILKALARTQQNHIKEI